MVCCWNLIFFISPFITTLGYLGTLSSVSASSDCNFPYPKHYTAYHLNAGEIINVDGKVDEDAWSKVAWTDEFMDIQGPSFPKPRFTTRAKMRWDENYLYIAAFMEETDVWANQTKHDSVIFYDNDFEVFIDPSGSTHFYKEFEMNAINTTWDLELNKPYLNGGTPNSSWEMPTMKTATFVDGPVNDPLVKNTYWTAEIAMPFKDLIHGKTGMRAPPKNGDQWRINFSRVEWHVRVVNGHYEKVPNIREDNWVWSSQNAINMHLPERWGFLLFSKEAVNQTTYTKYPDWNVYYALTQVYNAEKAFAAVNGYFTDVLDQLNLPSSITQGKCAKIPKVDVPKFQTSKFNVTVSPLVSGAPIGHISDDRLIWFEESKIKSLFLVKICRLFNLSLCQALS
ncbi:uncharacterized protein LOC106165211 [Lingula anatina]|uniref:Uncharacterized protein LOC106165211 n=1 Tax=Lingula anatina TaxID=7574 RepID=A0A1S3IL13_LINAN|nr:uncharacterized protein LOC106165211 [Lingula anatina]|eukprot:XP_013398778.1 uncharacterized protein LOC106165211 [Lingula anatina]